MPVEYYTRTGGSRASSYWFTKNGTKQVPFNPEVKPPLPYYLNEERVSGWGLPDSQKRVDTSFWGNLPTVLAFQGTDISPTFDTRANAVYSRAYQKFLDKAVDTASNLTALKERGKTIDMILSRLTQLHKGATALKKGRFKEFLGTFGIRPLKKHERTKWTRPKQFGALWLEYWMGWAPTIGDVYNSIDALNQKVPDQTIRAGSRQVFTKSAKYSLNSAISSSCNNVDNITVSICGQVEVTNPTFFTANVLGLINPAKTVWETIGFSWLVDWFTNVGQMLGQFTDWVGLRLMGLCISAKQESVEDQTLRGANLLFDSSWQNVASVTREHKWFRRYTPKTLPLIKPIFRLPNGLSLTRGATLCSLLVTMFAPLKGAH